jgi:uncharacterized protein
MIEFDPDAKNRCVRVCGIKIYIEDLFASRVDVVDREALKPYVRGPATSDAIYAF